MTANPFAALLRDVPRLAMETTVNGEHIIVCNDGPFVRYDRILAALAAAVPADMAEAGKVLEGVTLAIDEDDDAYLVPSGAEGNLVALPARGDDYAIQHPEIWQAMVARFNVYPALIARLAAQEAQIKGLEKDREAGAKDYCALMERYDGLHNALAAMTKERDSLKAEVQRWAEKLEGTDALWVEAETALAAERAKVAETADWQEKQRRDAFARRHLNAPEDAHVAVLCERYGYGAVMDAASRLWARKDSIGAFYIGGCIRISPNAAITEAGQ